jgi:hypothetical protein
MAWDKVDLQWLEIMAWDKVNLQWLEIMAWVKVNLQWLEIMAWDKVNLQWLEKCGAYIINGKKKTVTNLFHLKMTIKLFL